jgi:uncharacterized protein YaaN involved in tellurite resistance
LRPSWTRRGVGFPIHFDIGTVKHANQALIETIEESLRIADEGRRARAAAGVELQQMESELRRTLAAASAPPARDTSP